MSFISGLGRVLRVQHITLVNWGDMDWTRRVQSGQRKACTTGFKSLAGDSNYNWQPVTWGVTQRLILELIPSDIFINKLTKEIQCTASKSANDTKLEAPADMLEGRAGSPPLLRTHCLSRKVQHGKICVFEFSRGYNCLAKTKKITLSIF